MASPPMTAAQVASVVGLVGAPAGTTVAEWVTKARQESSFVPDAVNGTHIGLWQIAYKLHAGKGDLSKIPEVAKKQLENPLANMKVAAELYRESGWKPWNASGGKPHPSRKDEEAAANPDAVITGKDTPLDSVFGALDDLPKAVAAIATMISDAAGWLTDRHNIGRIAFVGIGSVVIISSLIVIAKPAVTETIAETRPV